MQTNFVEDQLELHGKLIANLHNDSVSVLCNYYESQLYNYTPN